MRRLILLFLALPGYAQTPVQPSNLTLNTLTVTGAMSTPVLRLGTGAYTLILPVAPPTQNAILGIQSVNGTTAQSQWVKGYNGTLRIANCTLTVVNGLITGKAGGC